MKKVNLKYTDVLQNYQNKVLEWHDLMLGTFTVDHVMNYLTNPNLIKQELTELGTATEDANAVEILDAYLDTLWEIIPVINFLKNFIEFYEKFAGEPMGNEALFGANPTVEETKEDFYYWSGTVIYVFLRKLSPNELLDSISMINTLLNLQQVITVLLTESLSPESLEAATKEVIDSNFSKFILSDEIPSDAIIEDSLAAYGSLTLETSKGDPRLFILKDPSGKIRKPIGLFREPCLVKTFTGAEAVNLIDLAIPLLEASAFSI